MAIDLFTIGPVTVHGYGLMIGIGFAVAILLGCALAKKRGLSEDYFINVALWTIVIGFLGGKLLYLIVNFDDFISNPLKTMGSEGFVVYGGIITGVATIYVYCRIKKLEIGKYFDLIGTVTALNQAFGRVGCFLAGCCYGRKTDSFIGVVFPEGCIAPAGVKLLPTQLFMAAGDLVIFIVLLYLGKSKKCSTSGVIMCHYLLMYSIGRFIIEYFRDDAERGYVGFLSTSQFIAIWIALASVIIMRLLIKNEKAKAPIPDTESAS